MCQDIPVEYRESLTTTETPLPSHFIPNLLRSVSPQWVLETLFTFIWTMLRETPTAAQPDWSLKVKLQLREWSVYFYSVI